MGGKLTGRLGRVAVAGHSMAPTLREGDWLVYARLGRPPRVGEIVIARDPREPERWLVKRVRAVREAEVDLAGDMPGHDVEAVPHEALLGRVVLRYWPPRRIGRP